MQNNRTVFVFGVFNILHPGHLRLLRFAKDCGGRLSVGIFSDRIAGKSSHVPQKLRYDAVECNVWVDEAFIADDSAVDIIIRLKPDVVVKGKEYESLNNPEQSVVESYGGKLIFSSGESQFSSFEMLRKEFHESSFNTIIKPVEYISRHDVDVKKIKNMLDNAKSLKVIVIGDLIVDEYITCEPLGMSQEDPTIVVKPIDNVKFIGGASIVAAHAAGLGAEVDFFSVVGPDSPADFAKIELDKYGVDSFIVVDDTRPTTLKQRFISQNKTMLRVSHLHQDAIALSLQDRIFEKLLSVIKNIDLIVFSDFNYGCLPQSLVNKITDLASDNGIKIVADSQSSSQIGDISRFNGMDMITPTEREARVSTRNHEDGLVVMCEKLKRLSNAKHILLKLGSEGLLVHTEASGQEEWTTDRICALNTSPKDVSGAGDMKLPPILGQRLKTIFMHNLP
jgi:rfaE bifunctional protein kinase chain/domain